MVDIMKIKYYYLHIKNIIIISLYRIFHSKEYKDEIMLLDNIIYDKTNQI